MLYSFYFIYTSFGKKIFENSFSMSPWKLIFKKAVAFLIDSFCLYYCSFWAVSFCISAFLMEVSKTGCWQSCSLGGAFVVFCFWIYGSYTLFFLVVVISSFNEILQLPFQKKKKKKMLLYPYPSFIFYNFVTWLIFLNCMSCKILIDRQVLVS